MARGPIRLLALVTAAAAALAAAAAVAAAPGEPATVRAVVGGDTIALTNGQRVRLVQIDAPELHGGECYATQAAAMLGRMLPPGTRVRLAADPALDRVDRYGRLLRYVLRGPTNLNLELVARGAA